MITITVLEKLYHLDHESDFYSVLDNYWHDLDYIYEKILEIDGESEELQEAIDIIKSLIGEFRLDLHSKNTMLRGNQIVITDPIQ